MIKPILQTLLSALILLSISAGNRCAAQATPGTNDAAFVPLFDGKSLQGWTIEGAKGPGYIVRDGNLICPPDGGGNLYTQKQYSDFVFRFEFKLSAAGNNGVAIRSPQAGDPAYVGMEVQVLDDSAPQYANLEAGQYHGSIYKVAAAKRGALKPVGEWNTEEIRAIGRHITVIVNGVTTVDVNLNSITDKEVLANHPGMLRERGSIGFCGHGPAEVEFRNIAIQDLSRLEPENTPPVGFSALFNGLNLSGWKGLVADPPKRAKMTAQELATAQQAATEKAFEHWKAVDGVITYDGQANSLCTVEDFADFELLVDWKIQPGGDSGLYLRGSPQIQIWDNEVGSGGLYNNNQNPNKPTRKADKPVGEWNTFRILMVGDKVTVFLNNELVVHNVTMENYWERDKPIYPTGQIELQHHGAPLYFKNLYVRKIAQPAAAE